MKDERDMVLLLKEFSLLEVIQLHTNARIQSVTDKCCGSSEMGDIYLQLERIRKYNFNF